MSQKSEYEHLYVNADKWFVVNAKDSVRKPIYISLPKPPPMEVIDGYGGHPDDQVFHRLPIPSKLTELEQSIHRELNQRKKSNYQETVTGYKIMERFWEIVEENPEDFENELIFIKKLWWYRLYGYWFFNDGKPTFITGRHFMFLNFFYMPDVKENGGYPEYRDRHRREFLFKDYLRYAHHTFAHRDDKGWAIPDDNGNYELIDKGLKLFFGVGHPKTRRVGATIAGLSNMLEDSERGYGRYSTIISKDGESTEKHYNFKLLPAWISRPIFLKPMWDGSFRPTSIKYIPPRNNVANEALMSIVDYTDSAGTFKQDGNKINGTLIVDEPGKTEGVNVLERHDVYKNAMSLGDGTIILGFSEYISTIEEVNSAGLAFLELLDLSDFYQRGDNGQTSSGLAVTIYPSYDGLEGFIDKHGMSVIDTPTERQRLLRPTAEFAILNQGAYQYQREKRDDFLRIGTPAAMRSYRAYVKKFPWDTTELSIGTSGDIGFNYEILDRTIADLRRFKSLNKLDIKIGNFYRARKADGSEDEDGAVYWRTEDNGKFEISYEPPPQLTNQKVRTMAYDVNKGKMMPQWRPVYMTRFTLGADPVEYSTQRKDTGASKQSDPAMVIKREYDSSIDLSPDPGDWITNDVVLYYRYRPASLIEYCEDVLMAAEFFGAMIFTERNKTRLTEYIIDRGRAGYLKYAVDSLTGKLANEPGYFASNDSKSEGLGFVKDWIEFHAHRCKHLRLLEECRGIRYIDELTKYDGLAAFIACEIGSKSPYGKVQDRRSTQSIDLSGCSWLM